MLRSGCGSRVCCGGNDNLVGKWPALGVHGQAEVNSGTCIIKLASSVGDIKADKMSPTILQLNSLILKSFFFKEDAFLIRVLDGRAFYKTPE